MRLKDAIAKIGDEHTMWSREPLVIEFSHPAALRVFLTQIEEDVGMPAGELSLARFRSGQDVFYMYDDIAFREKPPNPAKEAAKVFWAGYETFADVA